MRRKLFGIFMVLCLCITMTPTLTFAETDDTYTKVATWEEFKTAWYDQTAGDTIRLELAGDITMEETLYVLDGKTYYIKNPDTGTDEWTLYNVELISDTLEDETASTGTVVIDADIKSQYTDNTGGQQILEDVTAALTVYREIAGTLNVTVNGNVTGSLVARGYVDVTVNGNVSAREKIVSEDEDPEDNQEGLAGVYAYTGAEVTVDGNVVGENVTGEYSIGGDGVQTFFNTKVKVTGNVTGGSAGGEFAVGGSGIRLIMDLGVQIDVEGNITGGSATGEYAVGGYGVYFDNSLDDLDIDFEEGVVGGIEVNFEVSTATVNTPNIIGGKGMGECAEGGDAVYAYAAFKKIATVNANIKGGDVSVDTQYDKPYNSGCGICAEEKANLIVKGNVSSGNAVGDYISSNNAVESLDNASVTITGDVTAGTSTGEGVNADIGVYTSSRAKATVNGNVTGGNAKGIDSFSGAGVYAEGNSTVNVTGNVTGGSGYLTEEELEESENYCDGGNGLEVYYNAAVTVGGNAVGGNAAGTRGSSGNGVYAEYVEGAKRTVKVEGNAVGGNVVANPAVEEGSEQSVAGSGIYTNQSSNVIVKGDAVGGTNNAMGGAGGSGIYVLFDSSSYDEEVPAVVRMEGTAKGGASTGTNGVNGAALYLYTDDEEVTEDLNFQVQVWKLSNENGGMVKSSSTDSDLIKALLDKHIVYIIKIEQSDKGVITLDKPHEKEGGTVEVIVDAGQNYKINRVNNNIETITPDGNGKYLFEVKKGGGYIVSGDYTSKSGSNSGSAGLTYTITVTDTENGTVAADPVKAKEGNLVTVTVAPNKGYTLETLKAVDKKGSEVKLNDKGDGTYTFKMPKSDIEITGTFMEDNTMLNFFVDVPSNSYFYNPVLWAVSNGITTGIDENHFGPDLGCTRAHLITFLYRCAVMQGADMSIGENTNILSYNDAFDIPEYAVEAMQWAVSTGIIKGDDQNNLMPNDECTREQMAAMLYRFAKAMGMDVSVGEDTNILSFNDASEVSEYAVEAMQWAVGAGIVEGYNNCLTPGDPCTRAQIVTMLYRLLG